MRAHTRSGTVRTIALTAIVSAGVASTAAFAFSTTMVRDDTTPRGFPMVQDQPFNVFKVMGSSPALLQSYKDVSKNLKEKGSLSETEVAIVMLTAAVENECKYCSAAHTMQVRGGGHDNDTIAAIQSGSPIADPKIEALRVFTLRVYETRGRVSDAELRSFLDAGYTHAQALDVVACIAAKVMTNYTNQLAGTPVDGFLHAEVDKIGAAKDW